LTVLVLLQLMITFPTLQLLLLAMASSRGIVGGFVPSLGRTASRYRPPAICYLQSQSQSQSQPQSQRRTFSKMRWSKDIMRLSAVHDEMDEVADQKRNMTAKFDFTNANGVGIPQQREANETQSTLIGSDDASTTKPSTAQSDPTSFLDINPHDVEIVTVESPEVTEELEIEEDGDGFLQIPFVSMFRGSANYISNHRNTLAVYHIPGDLMAVPDSSVFRDLMNDISLTWLLGMKIVLVAGCRYQIDKRLPDRERHFSISVTDAETLRVVKEEAGYVRFEVERQLARSLRLQGAGVSAGDTKGYCDGNVVSGNFYSAQPFGILDGVDYKYSGFVRRVEVEKIRQVHQSRDIVLLTALGVSPSGEVFNVNSESLAATAAGALGASKIIFFAAKDVELRHRRNGIRIQNMRVNDSKKLLDLMDVKVHKRGFANLGDNCPTEKPARDMLLKIGYAMHALDQGVKRAHIISPKHGALLQELYTRDGSGTMISRDLYDGIRQASAGDVSALNNLISPLIKMGTLVDRPKAVLEQTIDNYHVYTRDDLVVACGQLKMFEDGFAEIGCLVVDKEYRARGRGDAMLGYLERLCLQKGVSYVFVLSTQTMEWFIERGFDEVSVDMLPASRQAMYNHNRGSKIYMKEIVSERDLDASELWWNR
jgi:amino-acid N-acetyltransferase